MYYFLMGLTVICSWILIFVGEHEKKKGNVIEVSKMAKAIVVIMNCESMINVSGAILLMDYWKSSIVILLLILSIIHYIVTVTVMFYLYRYSGMKNRVVLIIMDVFSFLTGGIVSGILLLIYIVKRKYLFEISL